MQDRRRARYGWLTAEDREGFPKIEDKKGYEKINKCREQAIADGLKFVWIDTCCIDKSSSAELSEAINSMYKWYQKAEVCYAYLEDVPQRDFSASKWFERGWTLQELIAPKVVIFYERHWATIGSKANHRIEHVILEITGIDKQVLRNGNPASVSVAQRMSWAANRKTTRSEDRAYSLLGLFDVNMPLLYGEGGRKSFLRLQEEIMKSSDDQSLFAWGDRGRPQCGNDYEIPFGSTSIMERTVYMFSDRRSAAPPYQGLVADCPDLFRKVSDVIPNSDLDSKSPYSMTNKGLRIELRSYYYNQEADIFIAVLACGLMLRHQEGIALWLTCFSASGNQFFRINAPQLPGQKPRFHSGMYRNIYVQQSLPNAGPQRACRGCWVLVPAPKKDVSGFTVFPQHYWSPHT